MCIAVYKPQGVELTEETLHNCWNKNPDGAGFMYAEDGKLNVVKGLMSYEAFEQAYAPHSDKNAVLHFRIATHGGVNPENTHPFVIHDNLAMVHNGIITNVKITDKAKSDTWHFTEMYLKKFHTMWREDEFKDLVESYIGHSKLILMDNEGNVEIYKSNLGKWDSDCWFSNSSYETPKYVAPKPYMYDSSWKNNNPYKKDVLELGDKVSLMYRTLLSNPNNPNDGIWYNKDDVVTVKYFGAGHLITVEDPLNKFSCELATWKVDKVDEMELSSFELNSGLGSTWSNDNFKKGESLVLVKNYNHMRIGQIIVADEVLQRYVISREAKTGRFYSIPKTSLASVNELVDY